MEGGTPEPHWVFKVSGPKKIIQCRVKVRNILRKKMGRKVLPRVISAKIEEIHSQSMI